jgi:uncharacterized protein involved in exopolysaccharide biosynthesis/Mrp family chromosome partitioning ATPase
MQTEKIYDLSPYRRMQEPEEDDGDGYVEEFERDDDLHLRDYLRVVTKHASLVLGVFVMLVAGTIASVFLMKPLYTATATIQIERNAPRIAPVDGVETETIVVDKYDYYQTQYEVLVSRMIAARVIRTLQLTEDQRFQSDVSPGLVASVIGRARGLFTGTARTAAPNVLGVDPALLERYRAMLSIEPVRNSRLVNVSFTSKNPELASAVANAHVQEYTNASLEQRMTMTLKAKQFLETELAKAKDHVIASEVALNHFRKKNDVISLDGSKSDIVISRLGALNDKFTELQSERIRLEGQYRLIRERNFESLPSVIKSPLIQRLKEEAADAEAERARLEARFMPDYPELAAASAKEQQVKRRLGEEIRNTVQGIESAYMVAQKREEELGRQLQDQRTAALSQKDVGADYETLQRDVDTARGLYTNLLERLKDIDVVGQMKMTNISVVDPALVPDVPSRPRKLLSIAMAVMFGLLIGVGLAFFVEYLDNTVKTPEDVERLLHLPTLGVVPSFDGFLSRYKPYTNERQRDARIAENRAGAALPSRVDAPDNGARELIVTSSPESAVAEAYRTIRTGILLSSAVRPPQVILFTSASSGEGKTSTALNQALTLAQAGASVILIDADMRKPRVHLQFDVSNAQGLSTYLSGQATLDSVIHKVFPAAFGELSETVIRHPSARPKGHVSIIPSGPPAPDPPELFGSERMREAVAALRARFDYVVIDTPPVLPVTDALLIATMSDGIVLVVRAQETPSKIAVKALDRIRYTRAKIIGVVLNDVDVSTGDYGEYLEYSFSYYSDSE